jgi:predicted nucleic acid-binding Zn ribbon protein
VKRPRRGPPRALETRRAEQAVQEVLALHGISDEIRRQRVLTEWADLVGPKIAARTRPFGITDRTLVIEVASSAWVQELTMLRPQILLGLIERLGNPRLFDDIRFRPAGRDGPRPMPTRPRGRPEQAAPPEPVAATGVARENIVREVEAVDDLELRELIARVRITHDR